MYKILTTDLEWLTLSKTELEFAADTLGTKEFKKQVIAVVKC
jgi:hypothetical protein